MPAPARTQLSLLNELSALQSLLCAVPTAAAAQQLEHLPDFVSCAQDWIKEQPVTAENAGWRLHTRCERETLSRFPHTGAILFTIRTHQRKLSHHASQPTRVS